MTNKTFVCETMGCRRPAQLDPLEITVRCERCATDLVALSEIKQEEKHAALSAVGAALSGVSFVLAFRGWLWSYRGWDRFRLGGGLETLNATDPRVYEKWLSPEYFWSHLGFFFGALALSLFLLTIGLLMDAAGIDLKEAGGAGEVLVIFSGIAWILVAGWYLLWAVVLVVNLFSWFVWPHTIGWALGIA